MGQWHLSELKWEVTHVMIWQKMTQQVQRNCLKALSVLFLHEPCSHLSLLNGFCSHVSSYMSENINFREVQSGYQWLGRRVGKERRYVERLTNWDWICTEGVGEDTEQEADGPQTQGGVTEHKGEFLLRRHGSPLLAASLPWGNWQVFHREKEMEKTAKGW